MRAVQLAGAYSPSAGRLRTKRLEPESDNSREGKASRDICEVNQVCSGCCVVSCVVMCVEDMAIFKNEKNCFTSPKRRQHGARVERAVYRAKSATASLLWKLSALPPHGAER